MGTYRQPGANTDVSFLELNKRLAEGQAMFQQSFEMMQKEYAANAARNQAAKEKQDLARANGMNRWNKALKEATPKGGFSETQDKFLREKQDEYFKLLGKNDQESLTRLGQLLALPSEMSSGQGAFSTIGKQWEAATNLGDGVGGVDWYNSGAMNVDFLQDYQMNGAANIVPREENGNMYWVLQDPQSGKEQILNNHELVKGSLEGNSFFATKGDISQTMKPFMEEQIAGLPGDYKGKKIVDKRGNVQTSALDYSADNKILKENLVKSDFGSIMSNQKYMTSVFPQLIDRVQKAADAGDQDAFRLLYGDDMKKGTDDDYDMLTNEKAHAIDANLSVGSWVGSEPGFGEVADKQKAIAKFGMINWAMDSENGLVKPNRVQTGTTYVKPPSSGTSGSSMTASQRNFLTKVQKPENIAQYDNYQKVAAQVVNRFEVDDQGKLTGRDKPGLGLLASQLNQAAKQKALTKNPANPQVEGSYRVLDDTVIVFQPLDEDEAEITYIDTEGNSGAYDITSRSSITRMLADAGGMDEDIYNYYDQNRGDQEWTFRKGKDDPTTLDVDEGWTVKGGVKAHKTKVYKPKTQEEYDKQIKNAQRGDIIIWNGKQLRKT